MDQQGPPSEPRGDAAELGGGPVRAVNDQVALGGPGRGNAEGARGRGQWVQDETVEAREAAQAGIGDEEGVLRAEDHRHVEVAGVVPDRAAAGEAAQDGRPERRGRGLIHFRGAQLEAPDHDRGRVAPQAQDRVRARPGPRPRGARPPPRGRG